MNIRVHIILAAVAIAICGTVVFASDNYEGANKPPPPAGDANADYTVDIEDFLILKSNYGTTSGAQWSDGDFDYDGDVDIHDFLILKANYSA